MMSQAAIPVSEAPVMPAFLARATVAALRPSSRVRTSMPFSTRRPPTPLPIMPGATTATIGSMAALLWLGWQHGESHAGGKAESIPL